MTAVVWPRGHEKFYAAVKLHAGQIVLGTVVAIDPASGASSLPGYAIFRAGEFKESGTLAISKSLSVQRRLRLLHQRVSDLTENTASVLVIEMIRGRTAHVSLVWSVGVSIAASHAPIVIEIPTTIWKAVAKTDPDYKKGDEADALKMAQALIMLAKEHLNDGDLRFRTAGMDSD